MRPMNDKEREELYHSYIGTFGGRYQAMKAVEECAELTTALMHFFSDRALTEEMQKAGLLSPIYENGTRDGCWFCMNAKHPQYISIRRNHPEIWEELRALSLTPNLCSYGFKYGKTLQEVEKEMDRIEGINEKQLKLF